MDDNELGFDAPLLDEADWRDNHKHLPREETMVPQMEAEPHAPVPQMVPKREDLPVMWVPSDIKKPRARAQSNSLWESRMQSGASIPSWRKDFDRGMPDVQHPDSR